MMKFGTVALAATILAGSPAWADQCIWVSKPVADAALQYIRPGVVLQEYCPTCDHKPGERATKTVVRSVATKVPAADYVTVVVNGSNELDLAYVFVGGDKPGGVWQNLGALTQCDLIGDDNLDVLPPNLVAP